MHTLKTRSVLAGWGGGSSGPAHGLEVAWICEAGRIVVGGREVAVLVFRGGSMEIRLAVQGHIRHWRSGCGHGRRGFALELHAHAEADGSLERARVQGRAAIVIVDSAYWVGGGQAGVYLGAMYMPRRTRREVGNGGVLRVSEVSRCHGARVSEQVAAAVAKGAAVLVVRRMVVGLIWRAIEILQRDWFTGVSWVVVGIWVGHWSVLAEMRPSPQHQPRLAQCVAACVYVRVLWRNHVGCRRQAGECRAGSRARVGVGRIRVLGAGGHRADGEGELWESLQDVVDRERDGARSPER